MWIILWVFKIYARANFLSHCEQLNGTQHYQWGLFHVSSITLIFWKSCYTLNSWKVSHQCGFLSCTFNVADSLKVLLYIEQLKGLLPMWILSWIFKVPALANFLSHFEQQNGFSPVWNLSCTFNVADSLKVLSHVEQLKCFLLSLWIRSWIFKVPARVNFL